MVFVATAAAQDLYDPAPPSDAAFVRLVHADASVSEGAAQISDKTLGSIGFQQVTPYVVVLKGSKTAQLGSQSATLSFEAGEFYTVAVLDGGLRNQQDARNTNLAKAMLVLYNYTDTPGARLTTGDGSLEIIASVAPDTQGSRAVNALSTDLAVWLGEDKITVFEGIQLDRSRAYSAILFDSPNGPTASWIENATR